MCPSLWILDLLLYLHLLLALADAAATFSSSALARRALSNASASLTSTNSSSSTQSSTDTCVALSACSTPVLPYVKTLTIAVVGIFVACIVMAFVSVYIRRFCIRDESLYVRYQGMERSGQNRVNAALVKSLPAVTYEVLGEGKPLARECAVCLSEFQRGEMVRVLPVCDHAFHKDCVDMWLFSHTTCPLCRVSVLRPKKRSPFSGG